MSRTSTNIRDISLEMILYLYNVYEPCGKDDIVMRLVKYFDASDEDLTGLARIVSKKTRTLENSELLAQLAPQRYIVTYKGLRTISQKKIGWSRDQHRLYYMKDLQNRRGR